MNLNKLTQAVFEGLPSEYRWAVVNKFGGANALNFDPKLIEVGGDVYWDILVYGVRRCLGNGYDASDWQNSKIEREDAPTADKPESIHDIARSIEAARVEEQACMPWPDGDPRYFETSDVVNNPAHYTTGGIECIDAMQAMLSRDEFIGYLRGNIFKYQWRYKHKNGVEDLRKADWYAQRLIKVEGEK